MMGLTGNNANHTEIGDLLKAATVQAKEKHYEAAIASLLRAYDLMQDCSTEWGIKTYFRVARYYHLSGDYPQAMQWLQDLHGNVDTTADAREALYRQWEWRQKGGFAKVSRTMRNSTRKVIKAEIELYKTREQKIQSRLQKKQGE